MNQEELNIAVFTTKYIIDDKSDILYVYHEDDGSWQFHGNENVTEADARLVSLGEMIEIDETLSVLLNLPKGYEAFRNSKKDQWKIRKTS